MHVYLLTRHNSALRTWWYHLHQRLVAVFLHVYRRLVRNPLQRTANSARTQLEPGHHASVCGYHSLDFTPQNTPRVVLPISWPVQPLSWERYAHLQG